MNRSERLAYAYLQSLELGPVVFEPDGNIPPDFVVGGRIAVEVRRLNQHHIRADGYARGLEEVSIPLPNRVEALLARLGPSVDGECWWVGLTYQRPVGPLKKLIATMRDTLVGFRAASLRDACTKQVAPTVTVHLRPSVTDLGQFFNLATCNDFDAGGFVLAEVGRNLQLCIDEKQRKLAPHRSRYPEWWLALADHIAFGVAPEERDEYMARVMPSIRHDFDRIVLLDPRDYRRACVVTPL